MAGSDGLGYPIPGLSWQQNQAMSQGGNKASTGATTGSPDGGGLFGKIKNKFTPIQNWKDLYQADMQKLQHPEQLGLSESQRQAMIDQATQAANSQQQAAITGLNQSALAGQPFQAGAFQQAAAGIADKTNDAAAKAAVGVNQLNMQMVDQEKQRIFQEMDAARERAKENTRFWLQFGIDTASGLIQAAMGNPTGALQSMSSAADSAGSAGTDTSTVA